MKVLDSSKQNKNDSYVIKQNRRVFFFNFSSELSLAKIARMFSLRKDVDKALESRTLLRQAWRDTALVSVLGKQREMNLWVPGLPGLHCKL